MTRSMAEIAMYYKYEGTTDYVQKANITSNLTIEVEGEPNSKLQWQIFAVNSGRSVVRFCINGEVISVVEDDTVASSPINIVQEIVDNSYIITDGIMKYYMYLPGHKINDAGLFIANPNRPTVHLDTFIMTPLYY